MAEDLAEETWLRLVETAPRLRPDTRVGPWLFTVARNLYYSYCRSRAISDAASDQLISLWPGGSPRPSPFEEAAARELEGRVERALALLPASHREALLLVGVEGMTPAEAAGVCGLTSEAFRQRLSRARAALDAGARARPAITCPAEGADEDGGRRTGATAHGCRHERAHPSRRQRGARAWRLLGLHEPSARRATLALRERCRAALVEARRHEAVHGEPGWRFALGVALGARRDWRAVRRVSVRGD